MQINRLFEMVYLLMHRKIMTAQELATHFEVSKRTILRDIEVLTTAGIPIYTTQGKGGGIGILDNFVLNKAVLSNEEQQQILSALQGVSATGQLGAQITMSKLQSLFGQANHEWITVDFSRWNNRTEDQLKFEALKTAVIQQKAVLFDYLNLRGESTKRTVYPLQLLFKSQAWYLQAFCLLKQAYRIFRMSRMQGVQVLEDRFERSQFQIPKADFSCDPSVTWLEVVLKFAPHATHHVYDDFAPEQIERQADGSIIARGRAPNDHWFYAYILSMGSGVELLAPQSAREELARQLLAIQQKYLP